LRIINSGHIAAFINSIAPPELAEEWDNPGLIAGNYNKKVASIMICLDVTIQSVKNAVKQRADMILSHHPLVLKGVTQIDTGSRTGEILKILIENDIFAFCAHTNLDAAPEGTGHALASSLKLMNIKRINSKAGSLASRYAWAGDIAVPMKTDEFIKYLKKHMNINKIRIAGSTSGIVRKVALLPGAFEIEALEEIRENCDILITGDIKYHAAQEIIASGFCAVDAGHFATEKYVLDTLGAKIKAEFPHIKINIDTDQKDPFVIY
jgi:GTP cyclohydrolase I